MPSYDEYRQLIGDASSAEEKLVLLRYESVRLLSAVHGFAMLVQMLVEERGYPQMPPDFGDWCERIVDGTQEMRDLVEALTDPQHRDVLRAEREQQERIRAETFWHDEQAEFTELQSYPSFLEAINQTADNLGFSMPTDIRIVNFFYPSVMSAFSTPRRRVNVQSVTSKHKLRPLGYAVTLSGLAADELNVKGRKHEGVTRSLDEVVLVLRHWLIDEWSLDQIGNEHEWMKSGVILWH